MEGSTAKDFAIEKANEIKQICDDLKYVDNKELRIFGIEKINYLADRILEHMEHLDIKKEKQKDI